MPLWDIDGDGGITEEEASVVMEIKGGLSSNSALFAYNTSLINATDFKKLAWKTSDMNDGIFWGCSNLKKSAIGEGMNINANMFKNCTSLVEVELPKNIGNPNSFFGSVFENCSSLKNIELSQNQTIYGGRYFIGSGIEEIVFPEAVTTLGGYLFFQTKSINKVTIGSNVKSMGDQMFNGCTNLVGIYIKATTPPILQSSNSFHNTTHPIYVPVGCGAVYKSATNWSAHASRIQEYNF